MPLVPLASSGGRGRLSHRSTPATMPARCADRSPPGRPTRRPSCPACLRLEDAVERLLALVVLRVRLAGDDELDRRRRVGEQMATALGKTDQQVEPLVGGNAAREADGQRAGIEDARRRLDVSGASPRERRSRIERSRTRSTKLPPQRAAHLPQLGVWNAIDASPTSPRRRGACATRARDGGRAADCIGPAIQLVVCTPLVTCEIGTSSAGRSGPQRHATCCAPPRRGARDTPMAARLQRSASGVMLTGSASDSPGSHAAEVVEGARAESRAPSMKSPSTGSISRRL